MYNITYLLFITDKCVKFHTIRKKILLNNNIRELLLITNTTIIIYQLKFKY